MEDKQYLENRYNLNFTIALDYAKQKKIDDALAAFKRSLESVIKIMKITDGQERDKYKTRAHQIVDIIKKLESLNVSDVPQHPEPTTDLNKKFEQALAKLHELVGLKDVKIAVTRLAAELELRCFREQRGLKSFYIPYHLIFTGNPGTGKTTVAGIVADIFYSLGFLKSGQLVEVGREDLVAGYVGQTALKTREVIEKSLGGILFIDEAYRLAEGGANDFGKEALNEIFSAMQNDERGELCIIFSGIEDKMRDFARDYFLYGRILGSSIHFPDYTPDEMMNIFLIMCSKNQYVLTPLAEEKVRNKLNRIYANRDVNFANARDVRNLFEQMVNKQAMRIYEISKSGVNLSRDILLTILPEDLE